MAGEVSFVSGVAGRYASALFELAQDQGSADAVEQDLMSFDRMIEGSEDLTRLVKSPVFSSEEQTAAVSAILDRAGIGGIAGNFIRLAAQHRRLFAVRDMIRAYRALAAAGRGETRAQVVSAEPLTEDRLADLKTALRQQTGKDVALDLSVDPALIGGLTVKIGSRLIDASLRTKLQSIKIRMKEVG